MASGAVMSFWDFKRRRFLIKPAFQLRLALTIFLYVVVYSALFGFVIFFPLYGDMQGSVTFEEQLRISEIALYLHKRVWPALFIMAGLAGVHAIFYSHRVVGPVYRFERMLEELIAGNYSHRIRIRKRDELKDMEVLLNELGRVLERRDIDDLDLHTDVKHRIEGIRAMIDIAGVKHPEQVSSAIKGILDDLRDRGRDSSASYNVS